MSLLSRHLARLCKDTVTLEAPSTYNDAGEVTAYGAAVSYACHIAGKRKAIPKLYSGGNVETVISTAQVFLLSAPGTTTHYRITLPATFDPRQPPILSVDVLTDSAGNHYEVIYT